MTRNEWADTYKAVHATAEEKVILKVLVRKSQDEEYINNLFSKYDKISALTISLEFINMLFKLKLLNNIFLS